MFRVEVTDRARDDADEAFAFLEGAGLGGRLGDIAIFRRVLGKIGSG